MNPKRFVHTTSLVFFLCVPAVACAGVGVLGGQAGGAIGAFLGAFAGNVLRDVWWLRKHKRECPARIAASSDTVLK